MFGSIQPSSSSKESQVVHTEKTAHPHNLLSTSFHTIKNEALERKIREKETHLYQAAIKNPNLKEMPSVKGSILQDERLHSLGMAVTTVANIDMINNAYPHQNIKVDAQTEKTVNEICDNAPRGKTVDIGEDNAIKNRGKAFVSGFLTYQSPIDVTHYALALNIGHSSKSNEIDPIMINQFTDLWKIRSETSKPVDAH